MTFVRSLLPLLLLVTVSCTNGQSGPVNYALTADEFAAKMKELPTAPLIDVRTPGEFAGGHLPKATNIDWNGTDFDARVAVLEKSKPVFVYCLSGARSAAAAAQMRSNGFKEVYEMQGGMLRWKGPKETTASAALAHGARALTMAEFQALVTSDKTVLVDVYADWCGPCKKMAPFLDEIAQEMKSTVILVRIDADANKDVVQQLGVEALPTLFIYRGGSIRSTSVGYMEKGLIVEQLRAASAR